MNNYDQMGRAGLGGFPWYDIVGGQPQGYPNIGGYGYQDGVGACGPGGFPGVPCGLAPSLGWTANGQNPWAYQWPGALCGPGGFPGGTPDMAMQMMQQGAAPPAPPVVAGYPQVGQFPGAFGPFGFDGLAGCFGGPVTPLAIQQSAEPLVTVRPRCPRGFRTDVGGLGCVCIPKCDFAVLECDAPTLMKIIQWVIPSSVAHQLLVTDIKVGRECLLLCGPAPAVMFSEESNLPQLISTETADEGETISITLENVSDADVNVCVGIVARALIK